MQACASPLCVFMCAYACKPLDKGMELVAELCPTLNTQCRNIWTLWEVKRSTGNRDYLLAHSGEWMKGLGGGYWEVQTEHFLKRPLIYIYLPLEQKHIAQYEYVKVYGREKTLLVVVIFESTVYASRKDHCVVQRTSKVLIFFLFCSQKGFYFLLFPVLSQQPLSSRMPWFFW